MFISIRNRTVNTFSSIPNSRPLSRAEEFFVGGGFDPISAGEITLQDIVQTSSGVKFVVGGNIYQAEVDDAAGTMTGIVRSASGKTVKTVVTVMGESIVNITVNGKGIGCFKMFAGPSSDVSRWGLDGDE
ncbi:hypothetical protein VLK31_16080 [Variovorax sp. H27-G14]|uniref:hypothetical protein n=1 Tax=Variovorax sp. H27-G14 TaxID=3111914 RepID=UPI0038FC1EA9